MQPVAIYNPDRYMADLRQVLSQGGKRIGIFLGAGAPTAIRVGEARSPLIPDVEGLTNAVVSMMSERDRPIVETLKADIGGVVDIEAILTKVRRLSEAIGSSLVHGVDGNAYRALGQRLCRAIGDQVCSSLPRGANPYSDLVSWISGTYREHAVEVFTPNYDLLIEEAFERARVPFFDGFTGSHSPFFDPASVSLVDDLPSRWSRLWKLHGSLGWTVSDDTVVRTGKRDATELIYPDHLKYNEVTRLPYSAFFERLSHFLKTPDTLLMFSGFSFADAHICAVLDEALTANAHTAILAFQYRLLEHEKYASKLAVARPNISVYARDGAIINGIPGQWRPSQAPNEDWLHIRRTFWRDSSADSGSEASGMLLGDFLMLARFLALTKSQQIMSFTSGSEGDGGESGEQSGDSDGSNA